MKPKEVDIKGLIRNSDHDFFFLKWSTAFIFQKLYEYDFLLFECFLQNSIRIFTSSKVQIKQVQTLPYT
jgi:hypothetical protein